jgi:two-component system, chemotaxis family, chemotaxis protein CheY
MSARQRLLVVDDEADIRDTLRDALEDEGYDVLVANDGEDALRVMSAHREEIAVVILDVIMPNVDGNQVYERMKRDPLLQKMAVIFSTSDPSRAPAGVPMMKKPIKLDPLLTLVRTLAQRA